MANFVLIDKKSLNEISVDTSNINLTAPSSVHTKLYRNEVSEFIQDGNNLILKLKNGKTIVVKNFFIVKGELESELVFEDATGMPWLPFLLGGAAVAGGIAALENDSNGGSGITNTPPSVVVGKEKQPTITGENKPKTGNITDVKDPDGDQLTYKVTTQPKNGTVTIDAKTGEYTYTPNKGFNGEDTFTVTVDDGKGGTTTIEVPVSVIPAAEVEVTGYEDNLGNVPENIDSGKSTRDNKPVISGIAKHAKTVEVTIADDQGNVVKTLTVNVDKNGKWATPELPDALKDGDYTITAKAKDALGNEVASKEYTVTVDTTVDAGKPEIVTSTDGTSTITTTVPKDVDKSGVKVIDPKTGKEIPGLTVNGPDKDGKVTITGKVPAGVTPELKVTDKVGNEVTTPITDKTAPATVSVDGYEDNVGNAPENIGLDKSTNDNKPVISGSATNAKTVEVTITDSAGQVLKKTATVGADGKWSLPQLTEVLADGKVTITAKATNGAGKETSSNVYTVTVDTAVDAGQPEIITDKGGTSTITTTVDPKDVTKVEVIDPTTKQPIPGLVGTPDPITGEVKITGKIPAGVTPELKVTDGAGNEKQVPITDKTTPAVVTITGYEDNIDGQGNVIVGQPEVIASGKLTNDNKPVIKGTSTDASTVEVTIKDAKGNVVETIQATVDGKGNWATPELTTALKDGDYTITAKATNGAGKETSSNVYTVTVDTAVDAGQPEIITDKGGTSTITTTVDPKDVTKVEVIDPTTKQPIPGLVGTPDPITGEVKITGKIPAGVTPELKVTDGAGNEKQVPITDKTTPAVVTITGYEDNIDGQGNVIVGQPEVIASGKLTNDNKPVIKGTSTDASTVEVTIKDAKGNVVETIQATVDGKGNWATPELTTALKDGDYTITAKATNGAGKETSSNVYTVTVDTAVDAGQPEIITDKGGTSTITTTVDPKDVTKVEVIDPTTKQPIPGLVGTPDPITGEVKITGKIPAGVTPELKVTDGAGNEKQVPITDKTTPAVVTITGYEDNIDGQGNVIVGQPEVIASGKLTNDNKPVIKGTSTDASTVEVTIKDAKGNVVETIQATVDGKGNWATPELTTALKDGDYTITAKATNGAGKETSSNVYTVTVDTAVDAGQPEIITDKGGTSTITTTVDPKDVTKVEVIDPTTKQPIPGLVGTPDPITGEVKITGKIPAGVTPELKVTDGAGNEKQVPITDKTTPAVVTITGYEDNIDGQGNVIVGQPEVIASGKLTNDNKPVIKGTSTDASTVEVTIKDAKGNVVETIQATVDGKGNWATPELTTALKDGDYTITAKATNGAGKETSSNVYTVTVDTAVDAGQPEIITDKGGTSTITTTVDPKDVTKVEVIDPTTKQPIPGLVGTPDPITGEVKITGKIPAGVTPELKVTDGAGNEKQVPITDKTAPTVNVEVNADGTVNFTFSVIPHDSKGNPLTAETLKELIKSENVDVDFGKLVTTDGGLTWTAPITAKGEGNIKVEIVVDETHSYTDAAGNKGSGDSDSATLKAPKVEQGTGFGKPEISGEDSYGNPIGKDGKFESSHAATENADPNKFYNHELKFNISKGQDLSTVRTVINLDKLDNSFMIEVNGTKIANADVFQIQDGDNTHSNQIDLVFKNADGSLTWLSAGNPWNENIHGLPRFQIVMTQDGIRFYATRETKSTQLEEIFFRNESDKDKLNDIILKEGENKIIVGNADGVGQDAIKGSLTVSTGGKFVISDDDSTHLQSMTITLTGAKDKDELIPVLPEGISQLLDKAGDVWTLTLFGNASAQDYQDALNSLMFRGKTGGERGINIVVKDATGLESEVNSGSLDYNPADGAITIGQFEYKPSMSAANDELMTIDEGNDAVLYTLLSGLEVDANDHSVETWDNFAMGNTDDNNDVDSIKFSEDFFTGLTMENLLSDDSSTVGKFITVDYDEESQTATISVDRDGEGSGYTNETLLHLTNQDTAITLDDLLANHQIVIG